VQRNALNMRLRVNYYAFWHLSLVEVFASYNRVSHSPMKDAGGEEIFRVSITCSINLSGTFRRGETAEQGDSR